MSYVIGIGLFCLGYAAGWWRGGAHCWEQIEKRCGKDKFNTFIERNIT